MLNPRPFHGSSTPRSTIPSVPASNTASRSSTPYSAAEGLIWTKKKKTHTRSNSTSSTTGNPRHLRYYPPIWQQVLQDAKILFQSSIASKYAFPAQDVGQQEARECIEEIVDAYRDKDFEFDDSANDYLFSLQHTNKFLTRVSDQ